MTSHDVIIVGAGPAGSTTAALLAERGVNVVLVERATFPRPKPCAEYLSPEAGRILARLGLLERIDAAGPARLSGMRIISPGGTSFTGHFAGRHGFRGYSDQGLALPREVLDTIVAEAAEQRGATLLQGAAATGVEATASGVRVTVRHGGGQDTIAGRLLIGADGLKSRVARTFGLSRRRALRRLALVTHAVDVAGMGNVGEMHVSSFGYVGLASIGHGVTNVAIVVDRDRRAPAPAEPWFAELLGGFPEVAERMRNARLVSPITVVGPFGRWTSRATADGLMLVGDAADFHDPFTGEGIYAALHGGELAAAHAESALGSGRLDARSLAPYDRARAKAFRGKWFFERAVAAAVSHERLFNRIASRLARRPDLADLMIGVAGDFVPVSRLLRPWNALQLVI